MDKMLFPAGLQQELYFLPAALEVLEAARSHVRTGPGLEAMQVPTRKTARRKRPADGP